MQPFQHSVSPDVHWLNINQLMIAVENEMMTLERAEKSSLLSDMLQKRSYKAIPNQKYQ